MLCGCIQSHGSPANIHVLTSRPLGRVAGGKRNEISAHAYACTYTGEQVKHTYTVPSLGVLYVLCTMHAKADAVCDGAADVLDHWSVVAREVEERERVERHEKQRESDEGPSRRGAGRERNNSSDV